ncbi:MAG: bifunctional oligoribonuclease/PAP phosphatase NrnA [Bacteroidales bacterium]|jgi:phosphoesterase RecJ-like protein|nr:bifunctional oligoribonuclease/PAP phosphatase NrnA [Bacteroidales bacterium]
MRNYSIKSVKELMYNAEKIVIVSHYNPDGDAIGSALALYHFFTALNRPVEIVMPNLFPDFLKWIPGSENILIAMKHLNTAKKIFQNADLLFVVDMNAAHRSGADLQQAILDSPAVKVLIDHHPNPELPCHYQYSTTKTTSTCELVYNFIAKKLRLKSYINLDIARCIYTGMITDTGSLSYACNYENTYKILAHCAKLGVDGEDIHRLIYDNYEVSRMKLLGLTLSDRLKILPEYRTAVLHLSLKDLADNNYRIGDTEGFVNYGLSMKIVNFTAFFTEREDRIRISFRSKGNFDVGKFASTHFTGGGHRNASAANFNGTLEEAMQKFEEVLPQYQNELSSTSEMY